MGRSSQNRQCKWLMVNERVFKIFIFVPKYVLGTEPTADTAKGKPETKRFTESPQRPRRAQRGKPRNMRNTRKGSTERTLTRHRLPGCTLFNFQRAGTCVH